MLYRILTETKDNLYKIADKYFDGYTLYTAHGVWKGMHESATIIEVCLPTSQHETKAHVDMSARVATMAEEIRVTNNQDAVLVQVIDADVTFATASMKASAGKPTTTHDISQIW